MGQTLSRKDRILKGDKVAFPTKSEQILMKHVAEGGSGGGLLFEKIGEHYCKWLNGNTGGSVSYYKISDDIFAIDLMMGGSPTVLKKHSRVLIDDNALVKEHFTGHYGVFPVLAIYSPSGETTYQTVYAYLDNSGLYINGCDEDITATAITGFGMFIGKLAD